MIGMPVNEGVEFVWYLLVLPVVCILEVTWHRLSSAQLTMLKALSYPAGETLSGKLTAHVKQRLEEQLNRYDMQLSEFDSFRPFMVGLLMMSLELKKQSLFGEGVDSYLTKLAKKDSKKLAYLESLAYQLHLFKELGSQNENAFIESQLTQISRYQHDYIAMLAAWRNGNMRAMNELIIMPLKEHDPHTYQILIKQRNLNWLNHIEHYLTDQQKELVVVGVAHLAGEDSLLALLKNKGYEINYDLVIDSINYFNKEVMYKFNGKI